MPDECCSQASAGSEVCELPTLSIQREERPDAFCPRCGHKGSPVQGQTVKALLSASLRSATNGQYYFCRNAACPAVYFTSSGASVFTTADVRERVYHKAPDADDTPVCYCFRHTVGDLRAATLDERLEILKDVNDGIQADQCACDLRNPQGACCLGNVRALIKHLEQTTAGK